MSYECGRHTLPILAPEGHTNLKFKFSPEVAPDGGGHTEATRRSTRRPHEGHTTPCSLRVAFV